MLTPTELTQLCAKCIAGIDNTFSEPVAMQLLQWISDDVRTLASPGGKITYVLSDRINRVLIRHNLMSTDAVSRPNRLPSSHIFKYIPSEESACIHTNSKKDKLPYLQIIIGPHHKTDQCVPITISQAEITYNKLGEKNTFVLHLSEMCIRTILVYFDGRVEAEIYGTALRILLREGNSSHEK